MGLLAAISDTIDGLGTSRGAPSYYGAGTTYLAGPLAIDAFGAKRGPSPYELIEQHKTLIYSCVQMNALGVARTPLRLYVDESKGGRAKDAAGPRSISRATWRRLSRAGMLRRSTPQAQVQEVTDHPLLWMLDHPDSEGYFSRHDLIGLMVAYCDVVGVAYAKLDPPAGRVPPRNCWPLQAQYVQDIKQPGSPLIDHYVYFNDTYRPEDVLRFRVTLSLRDPYGRGYSPTYAALQYAQLEDKYVAVQDQLLGQGPRPNLLISAKDATMPMGDKERERYTQDLVRLHARGGAGGVLAVNGAVDVTPLTYSPTDLSGLSLSQYDLERTCNVFGIPIAYFTKDTNLANLQAARTQHAETAIEPRCWAIAGTLTRLAQRYDGRLFFAFDSAVEEDKERDARISQMRLGCGLTTINEELEETQYPPKAWGDEPWLPSTLQQPTMMQEAHEQGVAASKAGLDALIDGGDDEGGSTGGGDAGPGGDDAAAVADDEKRSAVDSGSRLDAIIAAMERNLGL